MEFCGDTYFNEWPMEMRSWTGWMGGLVGREEGTTDWDPESWGGIPSINWGGRHLDLQSSCADRSHL